jgi:signal peptidase I
MEPVDEAGAPSGPPGSTEPTWESPAVRAPIVTRTGLTGGENPVDWPLEGTFDLPVTPSWSGPPTMPLPLDAPVEARPDVDLGIPGSVVSARRSVIEWGSVLVGALVLAMLVRTFLFQAFYIPSPSMEPTLWSGDRILVNKLSYQLHDVNRGDLVVFRSPPDSVAGGEDLIKRVIALPGERVTSDGGRLLIGGGLLIEPYLPFQNGTADFGIVPWCNVAEMGACTVPDGHVFVMGDNRANSRDSRFFGPVPVESIVGRAFVRVWPLGALDRL